MKRRPTYLRVVATTRCNLRCGYCHMEGDPQRPGAPRELPRALLEACLEVAIAAGIRKVKFLGGEPLLRSDLPQVVARLRALAPTADLSVITAGVVAEERVSAILAAGLNRINVSIHGFGPEALASRIPRSDAHAQRTRFIEAVLAAGRPVKLNYVYGSMLDDGDLGRLLDWAAPRGLLVNVLDDLARNGGYAQVVRALRRLRGEPLRIERAVDPDSLDTEHWLYADGLRVELKDQHLGDLAPYAACGTCPVRARCKEGIYALRLTHDGRLMPCMDRPDLAVPLASVVAEGGVRAGVAAWNRFLEAI